MNPQELVNAASNVILQISASDLRAIVGEMYREEQNRTAQAIAEYRERPTVDRMEAAKMLNVSLATLWRWAKDGYLVPVKIGTKVLYRATDIERMLTREGKGGAA